MNSLNVIMVVTFIILIALVIYIIFPPPILGESYQVGNNTIANVTAIIDINDESLADSPMRFKSELYREPKFTEERWDELFDRVDPVRE